MPKTITYKGQSIKYDERAPKRFTIQRDLLLAEENPKAYFAALDAIFCGDMDRVIEQLDDSADDVLAVVGLIGEAVGAGN